MIPCASSRRSPSAARTSDSSAATSPSSPVGRPTRAGARRRGRSRRPTAAAAIRRGDHVPAAGARPPQPTTIWARELRSSSRRAWLWACKRSFSRARRAASTASAIRPPSLGQVGPVDQHRDRGAAAANVGRAARRHQSAPPSRRRPHRRAARHRAGTGPRGSGHRALGRAPTPARRPRGGRQLEGEARHPLSGLAPSQPTGALANVRSPPVRGPPPTTARGRPDRSRASRAGWSTRHARPAARQRDRRRRPHRCRAETLGGRRAHEPSDDQRERSERPRSPGVQKPKARRTGRRVPGRSRARAGCPGTASIGT